MREQGIVLEEKPHAALLDREVEAVAGGGPVPDDDAPATRLFQPRD